MKKRFLSMLLVLAMAIGMIPFSALSASAETAAIANLHRGVLADGEAPNMVYWDAVNGVEKYEVKVTQGTTTKTKIVNDSCASWSEIFYGGSWSIIKDKTFTVEVTGGYSHGNLFVYETNTATLNVSAERQQIATASITDYSIVRGKTYTEDLWADGRIDPDLRYSSYCFDAWDDISGYPKFKLVDAPAWIQLWSNFQDDGWAYGDVTISFDPPADCTVGTYEFWIAVATSDTDGLLIRFKLPVCAYQGEDTQYWIQNMSIESPNAPEYWDVWEAVNAFDYLNATLIQGETGTTYVGEDAEEILKYTLKVHAADEHYNFRPLVIRLQNDDGQVVETKEVITVGRYRYHYSSETTTFRNPVAWVIESDVYYDENIKVYLDGKLQDVVVEEKSVEYSSAVKTAQWEFYGPWLYVYDEKPEIKTVLVNGESVADGATYISNSKSVTVKTTYDSVLSQALQDYGCTVKYKTSLNGVDYSNVTTSTSNGNGTSTQTYVQNVNSGSSLTFKSWLEVTWPDGSKDRVDERTTNVIYVDMGFSSLTPRPDMDEADWDELSSDLGTMALGSADTNIDFNFSAKTLPADAIEAGYSVKRALKVTRDGITVYDKEYESNEVYPWNLKDNIDEGGNYHIIPTLNYYLDGVKIEEISHLYTVKVTGSTIKTLTASGIGTPVIGKTPSTTSTAKTSTQGIYIHAVEWFRAEEDSYSGWVQMTDGETFATGEEYMVTVTFKTNDGYSFKEDPDVMKAYINGVEATVVDNPYATNKAYVDLKFTPITTPAFTTQPVGGMAAEGDKLTVDWELNFAPAKLELRYFDNASEESTPTYVDTSITSADFAPIADDGSYYQILAYYNNTQYVASNKFYVNEIKTIINTIELQVAKPVIGEAPTKPTIKSVNGDENLKDLVSFFNDAKVYWVEADSAEDIANGNKHPTVFADGKIYALHVAIRTTKEFAEDCVLNVYGTDGELLWSGNISFSVPSDKTLVYTDAYLGNFKLELGDVNEDGEVTYLDMQRLYQHFSTDNKLTGDALAVADVNKDGSVTYLDMQRLYQHFSSDNKLS